MLLQLNKQAVAAENVHVFTQQFVRPLHVALQNRLGDFAGHAAGGGN